MRQNIKTNKTQSDSNQLSSVLSVLRVVASTVLEVETRDGGIPSGKPPTKGWLRIRITSQTAVLTQPP